MPNSNSTKHILNLFDNICFLFFENPKQFFCFVCGAVFAVKSILVTILTFTQKLISVQCNILCQYFQELLLKDINNTCTMNKTVRVPCITR